MIKWLEDILKKKENKIIIFSQWDSILKILKDVLTDLDIKFVCLGGPLNVLNSRIRQFKLDIETRIILLSSENSSSGLNLQEASHIVLFDTINDKYTETQAIGRSVRIGQKQQVNILRLIMRDTIEEKIFIKNQQ